MSSGISSTAADGRFVSPPAHLPPKEQPANRRVEDYCLSSLKEQATNTEVTTLIHAAWAIVAVQMTNSTDIAFATAVAEDQVMSDGGKTSRGPVFILPLHVKLSWNQKVSDYLDYVQYHAASCDMGQAHALQTLLVVQPRETVLARSLNQSVNYQLEQLETYSLVLRLRLGEDCSTASASYDMSHETWLVKRLLHRLDHVLSELAKAEPHQVLADIRSPMPQDLQQLWDWNSTVPAAVDECVHDIIHHLALTQPAEPAICAWDGKLTFEELDQLSSRLGSHLASIGVKSDTLVPLCFDKSMWTTVAMLGVLKAGAGFTLLDPSIPEQRLQAMVQTLEARLIVSSRSNLALSSRLSEIVVELSSESVRLFGAVRSPNLQVQGRSDVMFVVFTSGSTGTPKGVVTSHLNFCSGLKHQRDLFGFQKESRVLDFASYAFDVSVHNAFATLTAGGCLCTPSEDDLQNNISKSMVEMGVTLTELTPSVARLVDPASVPQLKTLILGGEAVSIGDVIPWWGLARIVNIYGPAESLATTINCTASSPKEATRIGKGAGLVTWVVDQEDHDCLLPPGCIGELVVEGPLVTQGYLKDPERTAAVFIQDPKWLLLGAPGREGRHGRLYKTGDLVHYHEDGSLSFVGRKDSQIKIRGQRVELGDVEYWVQKFLPQMSQVVAEVVKPQSQGAGALVAVFLQMSNGEVGSAEDGAAPKIYYISTDVEDMLAQQLPTYMTPTLYISIRELPMTSTGKTDRRRLRELGGQAFFQHLTEVRTNGQERKRKPVSETEREMRRIWGEVLNIDAADIGMDDNFLHLGGDSILAMKVSSVARSRSMAVRVADILRQKTISNLTNGLSPPVMNADTTTLSRSRERDTVEQSFAQERLWFLDQLYPGLTWYQMGVAVRFRGSLQLGALNVALLALERRHEILRTTFKSIGCVNVQVIHPFEPKELNIVDVSSSTEQDAALLVQKDQTAPFNLETSPGWRVTVYRRDDSDHIMSIAMHHIMHDGWSIDILRRELSAFYSAALCGQDPLSNIKPLPMQYRDYSVWERQQGQVDKYEQHLKYWEKQLETSRPAQLLLDKPRPPTLSGRAGVQRLNIDGTLFTKLQKFCEKLEITPFVAFLAAFRATHFHLTGATDATIGVPNANRDRWELNNMIGFFINLQCIRIKIENESFEELVQQVEATMLDSFANQDAPFDRVVSKLRVARDVSRNPLVQILVALHSQLNMDRFSLEMLEAEPIALPTSSRFDLELHFYRHANGFRGEAVYSTDLYEGETISSIMSLFQQVLEVALSEPKISIASLPLMTNCGYSALEKLDLINVHSTVHSRTLSVVDVFRQQVAKSPDAIAVKDLSTEFSYAQLDQESELLGQWLARRQLDAETVVGVFAARSCRNIVAYLGILKAGLAYIPLDLRTPAGRMEDMLSTIKGTKLVLLGANLQVPDIKLEGLEFKKMADILDQPYLSVLEHDNSNARLVVPASNLAYVMFTSGSMGRPKGVMIEHRNIVKLAKDDVIFQNPSEPVIMAHMTNPAFDPSTWEIYTTLLNGGKLICVDSTDVLDCKALLSRFEQEYIQAMFVTPALLKQYLLHCPSILGALEVLLVGGDRLEPQDIFAARKHTSAKIINGYGPTENTGFSTYHFISQSELCTNGVPIGRALSNSGAYVMDKHQRLLPIGVMGELVVTGEGLARGYLDPLQNVDRFITISIGGKRVRGYRTGDFARYRPLDGHLEFFGRMDGQVKLRGQRIELGEIEHVLRSHSHVDDAVTVLQNEHKPNAHITSFVTLHKPDGGQEQSVENKEQLDQLYKLVRNKLPSYMMPRNITVLSEMPLNDSGKIDRRELATNSQALEAKQHDPVRELASAAESQLQRIWGHVLNIDPTVIGLDDDFFQLGGDSITAMQVSSAAKASYMDISTIDVMQKGTIRQLEAISTVAKHKPRLDLAEAEHDDGQPFQLSPMQQFYVQFEPSPTICFDQTHFLKLRTRVPFASVANAIETIVLAHPMLRARFNRTEEGWQQRIVEDASSSFYLCKEPGPMPTEPGKATAIRRCRQRLNIETGPLVGVVLFEDSESQTLFITIHHLVIDHVSWRIIFQDMEDILRRRPLSAQPSTGFRTWCSKQSQYAAQNLDQKMVGVDDTHPPLLSYWGASHGEMVRDAITSERFTLDESLSTAILSSGSGASGTRPADIMMAALIHSFSMVFVDRAPPVIFNEGHGRETWQPGIDLSHTIGWFTIIYPMQMKAPAAADWEMADIVYKANDLVTGSPKNGWKYFVSNFADQNTAAVNTVTFPVEVLFNYTGLWQQLERDDSFFETLPMPANSSPTSMSELRRFSLFQVFVEPERGQLRIALEYPTKVRHKDQIIAWMDQYRITLSQAAMLLKTLPSKQQ